MNIAYCSLLLPEEKKLSERSKKRLSGISGHKVISATIKGVDENLNKPVKIFNIINTLNYPSFPQLCFHTEQWNHVEGSKDWHVGYLNVFILKYITQSIKMFRLLSEWVKSLGDEKCIICVHHIYYPTMIAALRVKARFGQRVKLCLNTGDIPGKYGLASHGKLSLKGLLTRKIVDGGIMRMAQLFDCFVFVTSHMADAFNVSSKPFTVVEGVYSDSINYVDKPVKEEFEKVIFYAGALREEYGIVHLLRAFRMIKGDEYRLVIAGGGDAESIVKEYEREDSRISFVGFIPPKEVENRQRSATVIVNPRTSDLDFVRYSFPSKTFDALASGVPYVAHKLPCIPAEYDAHIQYAQDESDESLRDKLVEVCSLSKTCRDSIGNAARRFILEEKQPKIVCRSIVNMWESIL